MNRAERRQLHKAQRRKPQRGAGHIELPINFRFNQKDETALQLKPHAMLDCFREGTAEESDWRALTLRLNWGHVLAGEHFPDATGITHDGLNAMRAVKDRNERTGKWGVSQPEHTAIGQALTLIDEMQLQCTRRELRDALEAVYQANEYLRAVGEIADRLDRQATGITT